jgi:predicted DsbA family dithiol-disulfide isomerase
MQLLIDVVSDAICPWCFVGKRRLDRALALARGRYEVAVTWRPFELNPEMPAAGMNRRHYLAEKFGSAEAARSADRRIEAIGREEGIGFAFDRIQRMPNTVAAHRLIRFGKLARRQDAVVERLFQGYFEEGADLGDASDLADLAESAGLERSDVAAMLAGEDGVAEVRAETEVARRLRVDSVPSYIFNRTYALAGAQDCDMLLAAFARVSERCGGRPAPLA